MSALTLQYLEFDAVDAGDQGGSFEAMASVAPSHLPALLAETGRLLDWLQAGFGPPGALDDGADWDLDLQASQETVQPLQAQWQGGTPQLLTAGAPAAPRTTLTLALALRPAAAAALREALDL